MCACVCVREGERELLLIASGIFHVLYGWESMSTISLYKLNFQFLVLYNTVNHTRGTVEFDILYLIPHPKPHLL